MIIEYKVNLKNKTKDELILLLEESKNIIEKQQEQLQEKDKIINMAIELIARKVGSRIEICKNMNCDKTIEKECKQCAIEYFTKKAREV